MRGEVDGGEPDRADGRLEHPPEQVQQVHVERDVQEVLVQEAGADQPPILVIDRDVEAIEHAFFDDPAVDARAEQGELALLGEKRDDVDRDQRVGDLRHGGHLAQAHSGQRMPTVVVVMQSGQIGRPQFEHETPVSREGWR